MFLFCELYHLEGRCNSEVKREWFGQYLFKNNFSVREVRRGLASERPSPTIKNTG
jgi:hypothetical protein